MIKRTKEMCGTGRLIDLSKDVYKNSNLSATDQNIIDFRGFFVVFIVENRLDIGSLSQLIIILDNLNN